jgi:hypothetical protein
MAVRSSFVDRYSRSISLGVNARPPNAGDTCRGARNIVISTGILASVETDDRPATALTRRRPVNFCARYPWLLARNLLRGHAAYPEHFDFADGSPADDNSGQVRPTIGRSSCNTCVCTGAKFECCGTTAQRAGSRMVREDGYGLSNRCNALRRRAANRSVDYN